MAERYFLDGFAVGGGFGGVVADAAAEVVLPAVSDQRGVVDCVDLLPDHHHAHAASHAHRDVVHEEDHCRFAHLNITYTTTQKATFPSASSDIVWGKGEG